MLSRTLPDSLQSTISRYVHLLVVEQANGKPLVMRTVEETLTPKSPTSESPVTCGLGCVMNPEQPSCTVWTQNSPFLRNIDGTFTPLDLRIGLRDDDVLSVVWLT